MSVNAKLTKEKDIAKPHHCVLNEDHPYKNPDCKNGVLWGKCNCCDMYFCHVLDGLQHDEDCCSIYSQEEIDEGNFVKWVQIKK